MFYGNKTSVLQLHHPKSNHQNNLFRCNPV
jgi:hypothetical protein